MNWMSDLKKRMKRKLIDVSKTPMFRDLSTAKILSEGSSPGLYNIRYHYTGKYLDVPTVINPFNFASNNNGVYLPGDIVIVGFKSGNPFIIGYAGSYSESDVILPVTWAEYIYFRANANRSAWRKGDARADLPAGTGEIVHVFGVGEEPGFVNVISGVSYMATNKALYRLPEDLTSGTLDKIQDCDTIFADHQHSTCDFEDSALQPLILGMTNGIRYRLRQLGYNLDGNKKIEVSRDDYVNDSITSEVIEATDTDYPEYENGQDGPSEVGSVLYGSQWVNGRSYRALSTMPESGTKGFKCFEINQIDNYYLLPKLNIYMDLNALHWQMYYWMIHPHGDPEVPAEAVYEYSDIGLITITWGICPETDHDVFVIDPDNVVLIEPPPPGEPITFTIGVNTGMSFVLSISNGVGTIRKENDINFVPYEAQENETVLFRLVSDPPDEAPVKIPGTNSWTSWVTWRKPYLAYDGLKTLCDPSPPIEGETNYEEEWALWEEWAMSEEHWSGEWTEYTTGLIQYYPPVVTNEGFVNALRLYNRWPYFRAKIKAYRWDGTEEECNSSARANIPNEIGPPMVGDEWLVSRSSWMGIENIYGRDNPYHIHQLEIAIILYSDDTWGVLIQWRQCLWWPPLNEYGEIDYELWGAGEYNERYDISTLPDNSRDLYSYNGGAFTEIWPTDPFGTLLYLERFGDIQQIVYYDVKGDYPERIPSGVTPRTATGKYPWANNSEFTNYEDWYEEFEGEERELVSNDNYKYVRDRDGSDMPNGIMAYQLYDDEYNLVYDGSVKLPVVMENDEWGENPFGTSSWDNLYQWDFSDEVFKWQEKTNYANYHVMTDEDILYFVYHNNGDIGGGGGGVG